MGKVHFINAGAGSGKTYTLTEKFCEFIAAGAEPSEFILTTYTKAAAEEFRNKIKSKLKEKGRTDVVPLVESAHIGTIHSVAQSYVEKYWYLLKMSPALSLKEDDEMKAFKDRVLMTEVSDDDQTFFDSYRKKFNVTGIMNKPYPDYWKDIVLDIVENAGVYGFGEEKLKSFKEASVDLSSDVLKHYEINNDELASAAGAINDDFQTLKGNSRTAALKAWSNFFEPFLSDQSWENAVELLGVLKSSKPPKWVEAVPEEFTDILVKCLISSASDDVRKCIERIFTIASRLITKVDDYKKNEGVLVFSDLEVLFLRLLSEDAVVDDIKQSVKYVFVDEFQDVSPIQLKIFQKLSEIVSENYWVGDPKQSIYGFRGSDSALVNSVIDSLKDSTKPLEYSYRSLPQLVEASNEMFVKAFGMLTGSERLEEKQVSLKTCKEKREQQEALGEGYRGVHHWEAVDCEKNDEVNAALAAQLWKVFDEKKFDGLAYGDVAILAKTNYKCREIAKALRAKGLPVSVIDDELKNQAEVRLVLALMRYIAKVDGEQSVAELRKLLNDEELETILWGLVGENECTALKELLGVLRKRCEHHSVYDMAVEIIAMLDLRHLVCKWSMGQKRQANLDVLLNMASAFVKRKKEASVSEFIQYISGKKINAPFDNTGNTIKVLTYHKAKGLQWKMVILTSLEDDTLDEKAFMSKEFAKVSIAEDSKGGATFNLFPPVNKIDGLVIENIKNSDKAQGLWDYLAEKRRAEDLRLLYIGFTRAEKYLVRFSAGDKEQKWLENTNVVFDMNIPKELISDNSTIVPNVPKCVHSLPYDGLFTESVNEAKYVLPSNRKVDPDSSKPSCELTRIGEKMHIGGYDLNQTEFGTFVHKYIAVHRLGSDKDAVRQRNLRNAERLVKAYGLEGVMTPEGLVDQTDALFAYIEEKYGMIDVVEHELPFMHRVSGVVISGEIDLYVKTSSGVGVLVDFKNPNEGVSADDDKLVTNATKYWPQLEAYRNALKTAGRKVDHTFIYYPMFSVMAELVSAC